MIAQYQTPCFFFPHQPQTKIDLNVGRKVGEHHRWPLHLHEFLFVLMANIIGLSLWSVPTVSPQGLRLHLNTHSKPNRVGTDWCKEMMIMFTLASVFFILPSIKISKVRSYITDCRRIFHWGGWASHNLFTLRTLSYICSQQAEALDIGTCNKTIH